MKVRLAFKITIFFSVALLLSSCGYKDIDKRFFVVTIGVDKAEQEDKKYKLLLKLAVPTANVKQGEDKFIVAEYESDSITEAVRMIKSKVDKELDFSHAKAILFSEAVVKEDMGVLLDWFIRRRDIQKIAWVAVAKPNAKDILYLQRDIELLPSNSLFLSFGKTGTESVYIISEYLFDFRKRITEKGLDPILPIIDLRHPNYFEINNAAILNNEHLKLTLSKQDTKVLNILLNRADKADIRVERKNGGEPNAFFISTDVARTKFKIRDDGKPVVEVKVHLEGIIEEAWEGLSEDQLKECQKQANAEFEGRVVSLLKKFQEAGVDPLGLGLHYRAQSFAKNDWEKWQEIYPKVKFDVQVDTIIQSTGLLSHP